MAGVARNEFGHAVRISGTRNHVHALLSIRTTASVSETMRKLKSLSSGWVHKTIPNAQDFGWQSGYAAFTVSRSNADSVARYIAE
jgi:REP element-mobilizing transposase RayT